MGNAEYSKDVKHFYPDCVVPTPGASPAGGGVVNGADIPGGSKGTAGIMPEVTFVQIEGAPGPGESLGDSVINQIAGGPIANTAKK